MQTILLLAAFHNWFSLLSAAVRGSAGDSGQAAAEVSGPVTIGPVSAGGTSRVRLLMALPLHGQIRVAATLTCQLAEVGR